MKKLLNEIDELLLRLEDIAHGEEGRDITLMRGKIINYLKNGEPNVFKIWTEKHTDGSGINILGYAMGDEGDIRNYYSKFAKYTLYVEPIDYKEITSDSTKKRDETMLKITELEEQIKRLKETL